MIRDVRRVLAKDGLNALRVDDLTNADLPLLGWSGSRGHVVSVGRALERVDSGEVEYLVARAPNGQPIAKAGIDYASSPGAGTLWQLATAYELQGLGIGPHLVAAAAGGTPGYHDGAVGQDPGATGSNNSNTDCQS